MQVLAGLSSDWPWLPPPTTTTILAVVRFLCATWAPAYGVAGSSVPCSIKMPGSPLAPIFIGWAGPFTGQYAQAALYQALSQAWKGALAYTLRVSLSHLAQLRGQLTSEHCTAL